MQRPSDAGESRFATATLEDFETGRDTRLALLPGARIENCDSMAHAIPSSPDA